MRALSVSDFWRARRDLNPGSPAPQASVLIQSRASGTKTQDNLPVIQAEPDSLTRLRAHTKGILHKDRIINTLSQMKNPGLSEATLTTASQKLNQISKRQTYKIQKRYGHTSQIAPFQTPPNKNQQTTTILTATTNQVKRALRKSIPHTA